MHTLGQKFGFNFYTIPDLCLCGCNNIVYRRGTQYINGHNFKHSSPWKGIKRPANIGIKISKTKKNHLVSDKTKEKISKTKKGGIPWNKGIKTGIKTTGMTGKTHTDTWKKNASGRNHPKYGTHQSEETKDKIRNALKGKYTGEKSPSWQGGTSFLPYCHKFNKILKIVIKERDNYTCQLCGAVDKKLAIHHVHYDKENCCPDLITLCCSDNSKVNFNRKHYESLFMNKLNDRELLFWTLSLYKEKTV